MEKMNLLLVAVSLFCSVVFASEGRFPKTPDLEETPGKLCSASSSRRYPEKILYCERNVDSYTKNAIIQKYDKLFGYQVRTMNRQDFKIDHFIPLCAGGSNDEENLWPQHKSVYRITDPIEPVLCQKMLEGKLSQADAVRLIKEAKTDLNAAPIVLKKLNAL